MRSDDEVRLVLRLSALGLNSRQIADSTQIPRSTVRYWLQRPPRAPRRVFRFDPQRLPRPAYAYLLGLYLGDGNISRVGRSMCMRISLDSRYPGIVQEARAALAEVIAPRKANVRFREGANLAEVYGYWTELPTLFPQHGPGRKHERPIVLAGWQEEIVEEYPKQFLRGMIQSDGCRCENKVWGGKYRYPRYFFSQVSRDIMGLFCRTCDLLGIEYRFCSSKQLSIAKRQSVARLDEFVGPKA